MVVVRVLYCHDCQHNYVLFLPNIAVMVPMQAAKR